MARLTKFVRSSQLLWQGKAPHKLSRWFNLCRLAAGASGKTLGFDVEHFDHASLLHLFEEIFAREEYLFESATPRPLIFDCGANIGMATLFFKWLYPESTVLAFEADPGSFRLLQRNIQKNHLKDVSAHNVALWDEDGTVPFFVSTEQPGSLMMSTNADRMHGNEITVEAKRLSHYVDAPVDLLKLDVEGAETRVICDLVRSGKMDFVRQMIVEYHHHIPHQNPQLGDFLATLERTGWNYQMKSWFFPVSARDVFQDILIYAYR